MLMNVLVLAIGSLLLFYGIKTKTKFFSIIGVLLLCAGLISGVIDYKAEKEFEHHRVPFVIEHMMK